MPSGFPFVFSSTHEWNVNVLAIGSQDLRRDWECLQLPIKAALADWKKVVSGSLFFSMHLLLCASHDVWLTVCLFLSFNLSLCFSFLVFLGL